MRVNVRMAGSARMDLVRCQRRRATAPDAVAAHQVMHMSRPPSAPLPPSEHFTAPATSHPHQGVTARVTGDNGLATIRALERNRTALGEHEASHLESAHEATVAGVRAEDEARLRVLDFGLWYLCAALRACAHAIERLVLTHAQ